VSRSYGDKDWQKEWDVKKHCDNCHQKICLKYGIENCFYIGCDNIPCPSCGVFGLYGPKNEGIHRSNCRNCGFWQDINEKPYFCRIMICDSHNGFGRYCWQRCDLFEKKCDSKGCGNLCREMNNGEREKWEEIKSKIVQIDHKA